MLVFAVYLAQPTSIKTNSRMSENKTDIVIMALFVDLGAGVSSSIPDYLYKVSMQLAGCGARDANECRRVGACLRCMMMIVHAI